MAYSTPSPSDTGSGWNGNFSKSGATVTDLNSPWTGHEHDLPATPTIPLANLSVTSVPPAVIFTPSSSGTPPAPSASPKKRADSYPKNPADWAKHRERITALYPNHTLDEMMAVMEVEYDFLATRRMYKSRLSHWGVKKNTTAADVDELLQKVVEQRRHARHRCGSGSGRRTALLDIDEREVKKVQKYIKRNPTGIKKLLDDPSKPLDVIKALSVGNGKGRSGRRKLSMRMVKPEQEQRQSEFHMSTPPPSEPTLDCSPQTSCEDTVPTNIVSLIQEAVDREFNTQVAQTCRYMPQAASTSTGDSLVQCDPMLRFVLRFRFAHMLSEDGFKVQACGMETVCWEMLSARLRMAQGADGRAICTVLLYAILAALEMAVSASDNDKVKSLLGLISRECAVQQPKMAEFTDRLSRSSRDEQIKLLVVARRVMSPVAFGYARNDPGLEMYSRTVDISIEQSAPEAKSRALCAMSAEACVRKLEDGLLWMAERVALSVPDEPPTPEQQMLWSADGMWHSMPHSKSSIFLRYTSDELDSHKAANQIVWVEKWASEAAWMSAMTFGFEHCVTRKFTYDANSFRSPPMAPILGHDEQFMPVSLAPLHPYAHLQPQLGTLDLGVDLHAVSFRERDALIAGASTYETSFSHAHSSPSWVQTPKQECFNSMTPPSVWEGAAGDGMDGSVGDLYDGRFGGAL